jgi:hypothetical protein
VPRISWNEIQDRASQFAARWVGETYEKGESQSFWSEFLSIYDIDRRRHGAFFEYAIKKLSGKQGFIDLFWPGKLIAEQKSAGRDLDKANIQALEYLDTMPDHDLPRFIVVSDFATFQVMELETGKKASFTLEQLPERVKIFAFLIDETSQTVAEEDPVNRQAAEGMARLHNQLRDSRYTGHDLELLLVRMVFCLFADDAQIFERGIFERYIRQRTHLDGSDLGMHLGKIFEVLNTPEDERQTTLDEDLQAFPYINGGLFERTIRVPSCNALMRRELLAAASLNWSQVSPAIFGSMFQGVMDEAQRRNLGAHYTSERNILRVIKPLFLDDLYAEYAKARVRKSSLEAFHKKLSMLNFLDPACGCGNFLVITYRELRRLEHKVVISLTERRATDVSLQTRLDVTDMLKVNVNQMHGIEIEEFPSRIAQTALWLTDHQMNVEASALLGQHYVRLPLTASANIVHANALTTDWADVVAPERLNYILGNPPFIGHQWRNPQQVVDMNRIWGTTGSFNRLDFVTCWFKKAAEFSHANQSIQIALVATNSISQGEQVRPLWETLFNDGMVINFAHQTFQWENDARGVAAVHCVIVGFSRTRKRDKRLFLYTDIQSEPIEHGAANINGYLVDAPSVFITSRSRPPAGMPELVKGSQPTDGGHLILTAEEAQCLREYEPQSEPFIRQYMGGAELINGRVRYCLWLKDASPQQLRSMPLVLERLQAVKEVRLESPTASVRAFAQYPRLFTQDRQPDTDYLAIPEVSSERRDYIPVGYLPASIVASNQLQLIRVPSRYIFGVLSSQLYMAWMHVVAGRLKSDFRHSPAVYNNFPWPENVTDAQRAQIEALAQAVLDARALHPESTLADLYDPLSMPKELSDAHHKLDRAVDRLYQRKPFATDADRVALLFKRYQELTASQV